VNLIQRPGIMRIGFDDLLAALRGGGGRCLFGYGESESDNRAHEALAQALKNPLMDRGRMLAEASRVLVQVAGGPAMTLSEVEILMRELNKHISDRTQLLFGTAVDGRMGNRLSVTLISSLACEPTEPVQTFAPVTAPEPIVRTPEPAIMSAVVREVPQPETPSPMQPEQRFGEEPKVELREPEEVLHVETTPSIHSLVPPDQVEESTLIEAEGRFQSEPQSEPVEEVVEAPPPRIIPPKKKPAVAQKPTTPQVLPPPESPIEKRAREKSAAKQEVLQFEPVTRGRFEKSEPTIVEGQDLDVPTFLRKNVRVK
jgi:cell division protein FtsZ